MLEIMLIINHEAHCSLLISKDNKQGLVNKCVMCNTCCALCYEAVSEPTLELGSQWQSTASICHIQNRPAGARSSASSKRWHSDQNKITTFTSPAITRADHHETFNEQAKRSASRTGQPWCPSVDPPGCVWLRGVLDHSHSAAESSGWISWCLHWWCHRKGTDHLLISVQE